MELLIQNFIQEMYWIDLSAVVLVVIGLGMWINFHHAPAIIKRNKAYNEQLEKLRQEVFFECEKNFFL